MAKLKLSLEKREDIGKNKVDKLRNRNLIPGVYYIKGQESIPVMAETVPLTKVSEEAGTATIVNLELDGKEQLALFKDVQKHPYKNQILHFDLMGIDLTEKLRINIPVVLEGRENIHVEPSVLLQLLDEIEVECLPTNLPSEAVVVVEDMEIGDVLTVADTDVAGIEGIEILTELDEPIASLNEPREEEIEEEEEIEDISAADVPTVDETEEPDDDEIMEEESEEEEEQEE